MFPNIVRHAVQRLKTRCTATDKVKIAEIHCRAKLELGATNVDRITYARNVLRLRPERYDSMTQLLRLPLVQ